MTKLLLGWIASFALLGAAFGAVDANTASPEALQTVRGIGPSVAGRIVAERRKGPYKDLADLEARVKGIGPATARRLAAAGLTVGRGAPVKDARGDGAQPSPDRAAPDRSRLPGPVRKGPAPGPAESSSRRAAAR
jgi:competence protein ComEA